MRRILIFYFSLSPLRYVIIIIAQNWCFVTQIHKTLLPASVPHKYPDHHLVFRSLCERQPGSLVPSRLDYIKKSGCHMLIVVLPRSFILAVSRRLLNPIQRGSKLATFWTKIDAIYKPKIASAVDQSIVWSTDISKFNFVNKDAGILDVSLQAVSRQNVHLS